MGITRKLKTEENNYVYDYQLIRKEKVKETRILIEENGESVHIEGAPQKTKRFYYRNIIFGPIGLFSVDAQKLHDYIIEEETKLWGKPIVVVKVLPKKPEESEQLYGKAWLDKKDGSILKIEWEETSIENYAAMKEFAKNIQGRPSLKFISEYKFEKNGIRFPNRCYMKEDYIGKGGVGAGFVLLEKSELIIEYKDYKFFIVETEVKY